MRGRAYGAISGLDFGYNYSNSGFNGLKSNKSCTMLCFLHFLAVFVRHCIDVQYELG